VVIKIFDGPRVGKKKIKETRMKSWINVSQTRHMEEIDY